MQAVLGNGLQVGRTNEDGQWNDDAEQLLLAVAEHELSFHRALREQHSAGAGPLGGGSKGPGFKGSAHKWLLSSTQ